MNKLILVLGAGASNHLKFPIGSELISVMDNYLYSEKNQTGHSLTSFLGHDKQVIDDFHRQLKITQEDTIDELLEKLPQFRNIGKDLISIALLQWEQTDSYTNSNTNNWYKLLYRYIKKDNFSGVFNNEIKIVSFNYDRSFENYLRWTIDNAQLDQNLSEKVIKGLNIVHVHGSLGSLRRDSESYLPYDYWSKTFTDVDSLKKTADEIIKIRSRYVMADEDHILRDKISQDLERNFDNNLEASVWYLGFGFSTTNIKKLPLQGRCNNFGTAYNNAKEIEGLRERFGRIHNSYALHLESIDCYTFLDKKLSLT